MPGWLLIGLLVGLTLLSLLPAASSDTSAKARISRLAEKPPVMPSRS